MAHAHGLKTRRPGCAPVRLHKEAALLWGLGREASRELPGQEAQHIHSPPAGSHAGLWEKRQIQHAGQKLCELPLCTSLYRLQRPGATSFVPFSQPTSNASYKVSF
jgi:hypothetical protein